MCQFPKVPCLIVCVETELVYKKDIGLISFSLLIILYLGSFNRLLFYLCLLGLWVTDVLSSGFYLPVFFYSHQYRLCPNRHLAHFNSPKFFVIFFFASDQRITILEGNPRATQWINFVWANPDERGTGQRWQWVVLISRAYVRGLLHQPSHSSRFPGRLFPSLCSHWDKERKIESLS
jgi:hypothetical protein